jgi:hypothetical protein
MSKSKKDFKGFDDYVEIFRGGMQTDSSGKEHDGDAMIEKAFASFQLQEHQPPMVVGHPKDNDPAYGWVKGLRVKEGVGVPKTLLAKFEDVVPEFEDLVAAGRYKKRSASFYPDGRLRHVGFLGAVPPAVKGLADLKFQDEEAEMLTFDFHENSYKTGVLARIMGRMREWLIEKEGVDTADRVIPGWDVDTLKEEAVADEDLVSSYSETTEKKEKEMAPSPGNGAESAVSFTEADLEKAKADARQEGKDTAAAEFAEQESSRKKEDATAAIKDFFDQGIEKGILLPAWVDGGLQEFMEGLDGEEVISFSEENKQTRLDWFMDFMGNLPQVVNFKEIVTREDMPDNNNADDIAKRAKEFKEAEAAAGRTITITEAVGHVTKGSSV